MMQSYIQHMHANYIINYGPNANLIYTSPQ